MQNRRTQTLIVAGTLLGLVGCAGHGQYTQEHIKESQEVLAQMKSGTEWEMAQQQLMAGELDKASKSIDRSLTLNPKVAKSHVLKGRILMEKGKLEAARDSFLEAEKLDPKFVEAQYYLGIICERVNQPDLAYERYTNAIELDKTNPQYIVCAADMLVQMSRIDDAERLLTESRKSFEYNAAIRQSLGHIAMVRGKTEEAAEYFSQANLMAPDDPQIMEDLVHADLASRKYADAEVNLRRLLALDAYKDRRDLKHDRARCLIAVDRPVEARQLLTELTTDTEGARDIEAWVDLGNVAYILNDKARLRTVGTRLVALTPDRYEGYMFKAISLKIDGDAEGALTSIEQAVIRTTTNSQPLLIKGMILQDIGRADEARDSYAEAVRIDPNSPARAFFGSPQTAPVASHPDGN